MRSLVGVKCCCYLWVEVGEFVFCFIGRRNVLGVRDSFLEFGLVRVSVSDGSFGFLLSYF